MSLFILLSEAAEEIVDPVDSSFVLNDPNENAAFLPFGSGIRACVGQKFVIQEIATLFASLIEQYEVCANCIFSYFALFSSFKLAML